MNLSNEIKDQLRDYEELLLRYACSVTGNLHDARDAVQEAFIKYLKYRAGGNEVANPKSWLYRVTYTCSIDLIRQGQRQQKIQDVAKETPPRPFSSPEEDLTRQEHSDELWSKLDELSEREKKVVILKIREEKSYKEIAELMDLSVGHVGALLHRSLKKLGKLIQKPA